MTRSTLSHLRASGAKFATINLVNTAQNMNTPATAQTAHTATPWQYDEVDLVISDGDGNAIAVLELQEPPESKSEPITLANAAFIVKAVNNHDALVKALIQIDTLATCTGVVDPAQYRRMLDSIYRLAREGLRGAVGKLP